MFVLQTNLNKTWDLRAANRTNVDHEIYYYQLCHRIRTENTIDNGKLKLIISLVSSSTQHPLKLITKQIYHLVVIARDFLDHSHRGIDIAKT